MKVVLDTNGIVAAAFFGGPPRGVLDAWADGQIHVVLTPSIFDEYMRVCDRLRASYLDADGGNGVPVLTPSALLAGLPG